MKVAVKAEKKEISSEHQEESSSKHQEEGKQQ